MNRFLSFIDYDLVCLCSFSYSQSVLLFETNCLLSNKYFSPDLV